MLWLMICSASARSSCSLRRRRRTAGLWQQTISVSPRHAGRSGHPAVILARIHQRSAGGRAARLQRGWADSPSDGRQSNLTRGSARLTSYGDNAARAAGTRRA